MTLRIRFCGDTHCGHVAGLTPPAWHVRKAMDLPVYTTQKETWGLWRSLNRTSPRPDWVVANGDLIDGRGERAGGSELLAECADQFNQATMAVKCLQVCNPKRGYKITRGTDYHVGSCEQYENAVAEKLNAEISDRLQLSHGPWLFDVRHHIGGTTVPYGKGTQISKERLWDLLWSEHDGTKPENVVIRSHVHWSTHMWEPTWQGWVLPALQAPGTKFGRKRCSGVVHWGFVDCVIDNEESISWEPRITVLASTKRNPSEL